MSSIESFGRLFAPYSYSDHHVDFAPDIKKTQWNTNRDCPTGFCWSYTRPDYTDGQSWNFGAPHSPASWYIANVASKDTSFHAFYHAAPSCSSTRPIRSSLSSPPSTTFCDSTHATLRECTIWTHADVAFTLYGTDRHDRLDCWVWWSTGSRST